MYNKLLGGETVGSSMKTVKDDDGGDMTGVTVNRFVGGKPRRFLSSFSVLTLFYLLRENKVGYLLAGDALLHEMLKRERERQTDRQTDVRLFEITSLMLFSKIAIIFTIS